MLEVTQQDDDNSLGLFPLAPLPLSGGSLNKPGGHRIITREVQAQVRSALRPGGLFNCCILSS